MPPVAGVRFEHVTKRFGDVVAVDDLDLVVEDREFMVLLGPSGCGKTTTLRMIAGFMPPTDGSIEMDGKQISSPSGVVPPEHRRMSMIFQSYAIWPNMTVGENVGFGLQVRKLPRAEIDRRVDKILDVVQMRNLKGRYPAELSGGQQQRVALARAIVVEPEVLLLDEPLSNLDANLREEMRFEIRRLHDQYRYTTVYVTHDQSEAMTTADLIAVMNKGRVEQLGPPEEIYARPRSEFVARFIGGSNVLAATAVDDSRVSVAGGVLRTIGRPLVAGRPVAISVRQHEIGIALESPPSGMENHLHGTVTRHVFLGSMRDYTVVLDDKTELRVTAPPGRNIAPGQSVWLHLPAEQCRALAEG